MLDHPLLSPALVQGYDDHTDVLSELRAAPRKKIRALRKLEKMPWLERLLAPADSAAVASGPPGKVAPSWFETELTRRQEFNQKMIADYLPWLLPQFEALRGGAAFAFLQGAHEISARAFAGRD